MGRLYNFSAGPSALPLSVLKIAQSELLNWQGQGASVMEVSHRSPAFVEFANNVKANLRRLLAIPDNYQVLFFQGGASTQFSMLPLNLMGSATSVNYVNTGVWSQKAIKAAGRYGCVNTCAGLVESTGLLSIPPVASWQIDSEAAYLHYTDNETISGIAFDGIPDGINMPLVADMSSSILSEPLDVSRFGVIYAGAQKNMGIAGLTMVVVRDDLLGIANQMTPDLYNYQLMAAGDSMLNTPSTFAWYMTGKLLDWLSEQGGVEAISQINQQKAQLLYDYIDNSNFYSNKVSPKNRSKMNVVFDLGDSTLNDAFLEQAKTAGLINLKGHRSRGGMRASLYNAIPKSAVLVLINYMKEFELNLA